MFDYLIDHAYKNVWCTPEQDNQAILAPARLTSNGGAIGSFKVMWRMIPLPDTYSHWHVYQIGQLHPLIIGLFPKTNEWTTFTESCNKQKMICDVYTNNGINLPRFDTFFKFNEDRNLLIAVRLNSMIPMDFDNDKIYMRVYTNQYFDTYRSDPINDIIYVEGSVPVSLNDILNIQSSFIYYNNKPIGQTYVFVNGYLVSDVSLATVKIGDYVEFIYDSSIYKVVDFKYFDLKEFNSTRDGVRKYLLNYAGGDNGVIDFQDDIDVFLSYRLPNGTQQGVYYNKNSPTAMRNLTHRDYSLSVEFFNQNYIPQLQKANIPSVLDMNKLYVRIHIRKSGWNRPLVFEHNRIHELYKMKPMDIQNALLGLDSTVFNWRADTLENSEYSKIMGAFSNNISNTMVQNAYGYNAISKLIADTPTRTYSYSGFKAIDLPYGFLAGGTAYEYSNDGTLLGWHVFKPGERYICTNITCGLVELITGTGSNILDEHYGFSSIPLNDSMDYRIYACNLISGTPDNKFIDITDDTRKHSVIGNRITWNNIDPTIYPMVRSDARFLAYDTTITMIRGELRLTLSHLQRRGTTTSNWVMQVPMGELDLFLNNRSLIRGLDYIIQFPEIVILNKEYLIDPDTTEQNIHVRFTGFCSKELALTPENDSGFIEHGLFSNNNRFDLRDDKVLRIILDGKLKTRDDVIFSEFHSGISVTNPINGRPYQVKDIVVPLRGLTNDNTYTLREKSLAVDKVVSDYLTKKIPQPPRLSPSSITERYQLYSPFINRILYDLVDDRLVIENKTYQVQEIITLCKPYEELLKFDPTQESNKLNSNYVIVHPHSLFHTIDLPLHKYRFLQTVVNKYTKDVVSLSPFVRIS